MKLDSKYIDVQRENDGKVSFHMMPDDELRSIVKTKQPKSIYNKLPDAIIDRVRDGKSIRLDEKYVTVENGDIMFNESGENQ